MSEVIDLDELQKLTDGATPGPWEADEDRSEVWVVSVRGDGSLVCEEAEEPDARLIAAAINAMPDLLRELRAARNVIEWVKAHYWARERAELHDAIAAYDAVCLAAYDAVRGEEK